MAARGRLTLGSVDFQGTSKIESLQVKGYAGTARRPGRRGAALAEAPAGSRSGKGEGSKGAGLSRGMWPARRLVTYVAVEGTKGS